MKTRQLSFLVGTFALVLAVTSCTLNLGGPAYPNIVIPVSTEAMGELQFSVGTAVAAGTGTGEVALIFTEPQLTSFLFYKLQAQSQPFFINPQVYLRDGQLQMYGTTSNGYFEASALIILSAGVDDQGKLKIELTSANFGPFPVPNGLKEILTATIQEAYVGALGPVATGFKLKNVIIADGTMAIIGQTK